MKIAIIPARGGSKRILRKNIKLFAGKPMIAYAIDSALQSGLFDHVLVSTDDAEIAEIALQYGAECPFHRPIELADDHTPTVPVIVHAITAAEKLWGRASAVCCIYPCVPFLQAEDLQHSWAFMDSDDDRFVFPITEFPSAIQRALKCAEDTGIQPFYPQYSSVRSQDLEAAYYDVGQFYWGWRDAWTQYSDIHNHSRGFIIPQWRAVDIDTSDDWNRAEMMHNAMHIAYR